jgi:hypothetical protein
VRNRIPVPIHPLRIRIPSIVDVIVISDLEQIKRIEASGDVDRLHHFATAALPWWVRLYFRATKFHDDVRDLWFVPFESAADHSYKPRRAYLREKVDAGYSQDDVQRIVRLLQANVHEGILAHAMAQVVNRRFLGEEIPRSITTAAKYSLQSFGEAVFPWKYLRGRRSQQRVVSYCAERLPKNVHVLDVAHNIGEVVQTTAGALRLLQANVGRPVDELFTSHALTSQVPRIAVRASTFGGLLQSPTRVGQTVVLYKIGKAAAKTKDPFFTSGSSRWTSCVG